MIAWIDGWYAVLDPGLRALLTISWQASVLVLIVLAVHAVFGRWLSPRWRYALWSVVVLRLVLPVTPGSAVSVFNLFRSGAEPPAVSMVLPTVSSEVPPDTITVDGWELSTVAVEASSGAGPVAHWKPRWTPAKSAKTAWLAGAALVLGVLLLINGILALRLRRGAVLNDPGVLELVEACKREMGVKRDVRLIVDPKIASPALAGMFRPTLLIPPGLIDELPREELRFILLHELAHVKKHDITMNWLLIALSAAHWFNPLIWFAFARLRADRELARDAMVLHATGTDASQAYGQTIIRVLERLTRPRLNNPALAGIGDGMGQLKRRLRMIALSPKRRPALTVVGVVLLATLAMIGLTDAAERGEPGEAEVSVPDDLEGYIELLEQQQLKMVNLRMDFRMREQRIGENGEWGTTDAERAGTAWYDAVPPRKGRIKFDKNITGWVDGAAPYLFTSEEYGYDGKEGRAVTHSSGPLGGYIGKRREAVVLARPPVQLFREAINEIATGIVFAKYGGGIYGSDTFLDTLEAAESKGWGVNLANERFAGVDAVKISVHPSDTMTHSVWIDPQRGYGFLGHESRVGGELRQSSRVLEMVEAADGLWMTKRAYLQKTSLDTNVFEKHYEDLRQGRITEQQIDELSTRPVRYDYEAARVSANAPGFDESVYTVEFPAGYEIHGDPEHVEKYLPPFLLEQTKPDVTEADVLAFAEPILIEHYPDAYQQHQPFKAEAVPGTLLWNVHPVSGARAGVPIAQVRAGEQMQIQSHGLKGSDEVIDRRNAPEAQSEGPVAASDRGDEMSEEVGAVTRSDEVTDLWNQVLVGTNKARAAIQSIEVEYEADEARDPGVPVYIAEDHILHGIAQSRRVVHYIAAGVRLYQKYELKHIGSGATTAVWWETTYDGSGVEKRRSDNSRDIVAGSPAEIPIQLGEDPWQLFALLEPKNLEAWIAKGNLRIVDEESVVRDGTPVYQITFESPKSKHRLVIAYDPSRAYLPIWSLDSGPMGELMQEILIEEIAEIKDAAGHVHFIPVKGRKRHNPGTGLFSTDILLNVGTVKLNEPVDQSVFSLSKRYPDCRVIEASRPTDAQRAADAIGVPHLKVDFETSKRAFASGDNITIRQIVGTQDAIGIGGTYTVSGVYTLQSRQHAKLGAFTTTTDPKGPDPVLPGQTLQVERGSGLFELTFTLKHDGYPHISFYPSDGGESFGGVYFGIDATLLPWLSDNEASADAGAMTEAAADDLTAEEKFHRPFQVDFDNTPFKDVVQAFRDGLGVPVFANWPRLEEAGIGPTSPVTLRASLRGDHMMNLVFQGLSLVGEYKAYNRPAFRIIDGVVTISTERDLMIIETRVYDIRDLMVQVPDFDPEPLGPRADGATPERPARVEPSREAIVGQIMGLIRKTVGSYEEWKAHGGDLSSIDELNGNLVIATSRENHENIKRLLAQLREARALISVEAGFLFVTEQFAEESGISLGFADLPEDKRIRFLDDIESNLIVKSTRDSASATTFVMPRMILANGQKAYVTVQQQSAYVSGFERIEGEGGASYEPVINTINEGALLQAQAMIRAGGSQVFMALHPTILNVKQPIQKRRWEDGPPDQALFIEVPEYTKAEVETTISMLDQSTMLIDIGTVTGPMNGVGDLVDPVEEGVERRVYMLVKPTIIREAVEEAGVED